MVQIVKVIKCGNCERVLDESASVNIEERKPCPACGSVSRHFEAVTGGGISFRERLRMKARQGGKGRPYYEAIVGDDLHRKTGIWMKLERVIDRARDWYREIVIEPETGKVVHRCEESLSEHKGHGSAKHSKRKTK